MSATVHRCGNDQLLKLWTLRSGECVRTYARHAESVAACAWLPDGRHFISAGVDIVMSKC